MRIIGDDQRYIHKTTCFKCAAIIEFVEQDLRYNSNPKLLNYLDCPRCEYVIVIPPSNDLRYGAEND